MCILLITYFVIMQKYIIALIICILLLTVNAINNSDSEHFTTADFNTLENMLTMLKSGNVTVDSIKVLNNGTITNFGFQNGSIMYNGNGNNINNMANIGGVKIGYNGQSITTNYPAQINGITINNFQTPLQWVSK